MTTEPQQQDPITQVQEQLEVQPAQPSYVTREQMQQMLDAQAQAIGRQFGSQVSGLQSKIDRGLDAVRRDTQTWAQQQVGDLRSEMGRSAWLASLDEDQRRLVEPLLKEIDRRTPVGAPSGASSPVQTEPAAEAQTQQAWNQVYGIVESMGLKRDAAGVDYAALTDASLNDEQRRTRFLGSIRQVLLREASAAPATAAAAALAAMNPAVNPVARTAAASFKSADDVLDAYIKGRLTQEETKQRLTAFGQADILGG